jgi:uncharacterized protein DUF6644
VSVLKMCEWLENTPIGPLVRESTYGFPILAAIHILGLTVSAGIVVWFDLRLLGVSMPGLPVSRVYRRLAPWMFSGFAVMFISGGLLFTAFATKAYGNLYFRLKVVALLLAGTNALFFHFVTERRIVQWDEAARPPTPARLAGLVSIIAWGSVILAGRMMSYTMF